MLKPANPEARFVEVVPVKPIGLPVAETEFEAAVVMTPLSVNVTTGTGESAVAMRVVEGG